MTNLLCELFIDTSKTNETLVTLVCDGERYEKREARSFHTSQEVLPMIEILLREHARALSDVTAITVVRGPGSYTGLRVGIAIASTLSMLLHVPINGQAPGTPIAPQYENDPWK